MFISKYERYRERLNAKRDGELEWNKGVGRKERDNEFASEALTEMRSDFLRVHELEELLKDQETSAEQTLEEEIKRHREAYSKYEKEKGTEIELLNTR